MYYTQPTVTSQTRRPLEVSAPRSLALKGGAPRSWGAPSSLGPRSLFSKKLGLPPSLAPDQKLVELQIIEVCYLVLFWQMTSTDIRQDLNTCCYVEPAVLIIHENYYALPHMIIQTANLIIRKEVIKYVWGRGYAPSYDNCCISLFPAVVSSCTELLADETTRCADNSTTSSAGQLEPDCYMLMTTMTTMTTTMMMMTTTTTTMMMMMSSSDSDSRAVCRWQER